MPATYTFDVFSTLDGFGSYDETGDWGGYWGKDGPEFLAHRAYRHILGEIMNLRGGLRVRRITSNPPTPEGPPASQHAISRQEDWLQTWAQMAAGLKRR